MKCKTFFGNEGEVVVAFNHWAKGKALGREVIIHTQTHYIFDKVLVPKLSIVVYYPEGLSWDREPEQPKQQEPKWDIPEIKINGQKEQL